MNLGSKVGQGALVARAKKFVTKVRAAGCRRAAAEKGARGREGGAGAGEEKGRDPWARAARLTGGESQEGEEKDRKAGEQ